MPDAKVYLQVTRGSEPRNHLFSLDLEPNVYINISAVPPGGGDDARWQSYRMDAAPYIGQNGRTQVPVRYPADIPGVTNVAWQPVSQAEGLFFRVNRHGRRRKYRLKRQIIGPFRQENAAPAV